ncbi:MAG TPA: adenylate/guanylate cyclase domain-containing protein [bacterium]|nr:adenylate/guanylate cyclase domain-containing protein [bacterium]
MDQLPPLDKLFSGSRNRKQLEALRQQISKQAAKSASNTGSQKADRSADATFIQKNLQTGRQAGAEQQVNLPTYADAEKTYPRKPMSMVSKYEWVNLFSRATNKDVYDRLVEDEERIKELTRGVKEKVAVLFADIRSFSYISSTMPPDRVFTLLNIFLNEMIDVVRDRNGGYIDKIIGDCIMAYFGLPYPTACSEKAIKTSIDMQKQMPLVNDLLEARGLPRLSIGIGLNTGDVRAGFTTTEKEISGFTIIGEAVNLAAKLEGIAGPGEIVAGYNTMREVGKEYKMQEHELKVRIKNDRGEFKEYPAFRILWD